MWCAALLTRIDGRPSRAVASSRTRPGAAGSGEIDLESHRAHPELAELVRQRRRSVLVGAVGLGSIKWAPMREEDVGAVRRQGTADRGADPLAPAGAGDDGDLSGQIETDLDHSTLPPPDQWRVRRSTSERPSGGTACCLSFRVEPGKGALDKANAEEAERFRFPIRRSVVDARQLRQVDFARMIRSARTRPARFAVATPLPV